MFFLRFKIQCKHSKDFVTVEKKTLIFYNSFYSFNQKNNDKYQQIDPNLMSKNALKRRNTLKTNSFIKYASKHINFFSGFQPFLFMSSNRSMSFKMIVFPTIEIVFSSFNSFKIRMPLSFDIAVKSAKSCLLIRTPLSFD